MYHGNTYDTYDTVKIYAIFYIFLYSYVSGGTILLFFASFGVSVNYNPFLVESRDAVLSLSEPTITNAEPLFQVISRPLKYSFFARNNNQEMKDKVNRADTGEEQQRQKKTGNYTSYYPLLSYIL